MTGSKGLIHWTSETWENEVRLQALTLFTWYFKEIANFLSAPDLAKVQDQDPRHLVDKLEFQQICGRGKIVNSGCKMFLLFSVIAKA